MGRNLQLRGQLQVIELRTLNAEINELLKEDIAEVDFRTEKVLKLDGAIIDQEVNFTDAGIDKAKFVMLKADNVILVKQDSIGSAPVPTTFFIHFGETQKLFLTTTVNTSIKILAMK